MARIITCDICGKEIAHNNMNSYLDLPDSESILHIKSRESGESINNSDLTYEMCQYCTQRVMDFVKNLTKNERFESHGVSY